MVVWRGESFAGRASAHVLALHACSAVPWPRVPWPELSGTGRVTCASKGR